jgi:topoisomerase-4 subunit B
MNCYGLTEVVYENEEFNLLQHALNIEEEMRTTLNNMLLQPMPMLMECTYAYY